MIFDRPFEAAFRRLFVYNILFEDAEVDGRYLELSQESRVLGISAAGCGLASMVRFSPSRIDAVDINGHHLALAALKMQASARLRSHGLLYDMFGYGAVTRPEETVRKLASDLPDWMQKYWRKNYVRFERRRENQGLTAWMLRHLRKRIGLGTEWMHEFVSMTSAQRVQTIQALAEPVLRRPLVLSLLNSPFQQLALGVNFSQKGRMLENGTHTIVEFILQHLQRVAQTDVETNWFAWYAAAGHYNHGHPEAVPPYLRREAHRASREAGTEFSFHHESIFSVLARARQNTWTHYSLCDAMDWMPHGAQTRLLEEIVRTARPGAKVLTRSVESRNIVDECGLNGKLRWLRTPSEQASQEDRSCQYKRVDFYEVAV